MENDTNDNLQNLQKLHDDIQAMTDVMNARAAKWNTWPYRTLTVVGTILVGLTIVLAAVAGVSFITVVVMITTGAV